jgi:hypothetical protein
LNRADFIAEKRAIEKLLSELNVGLVQEKSMLIFASRK